MPVPFEDKDFRNWRGEYFDDDSYFLRQLSEQKIPQIDWQNSDKNFETTGDITCDGTLTVSGRIISGLAIGAIIPWLGGYFTDGSNGGYTLVLGDANTVAGANSYLNSLHFYVCDGAALNDADSPIFNGINRYLPNITDDRFIMGDTAGGGIGGASAMAHTHGIGSYVAANESTHTHGVGTYAAASHYHTSPAGIHDTDRPAVTDTFGTDNEAVHIFSSAGSEYTTTIPMGRTKTAAPAVTGTSAAGSAHTHTLSGNSAAASVTENRPKFLSCLYIMKVK